MYICMYQWWSPRVSGIPTSQSDSQCAHKSSSQGLLFRMNSVRIFLCKKSSFQGVIEKSPTIYNTPVQLSIKSITQNPLIGIYWWVIILMVSCATRPPRKAAVLGRSALGARTLNVSNDLSIRSIKRHNLIRTLPQQHTRILRVVSYEVEVEFVLRQ